jgi:putative Holliday junction resolvase
MIDERFTSTTATKQLQDAGLTSRQSRGLVDQVSALGLLEQALQIEDRTGTLAGSPPADWDF